MITTVLLLAAALVVAFVAVVLLRSSDFRYERSATIAAPATIVFDHVNTLANWEAWSPWAKLDPQMTKTYDGPAAGVGATHSWIGNRNVGEGRMTITDSRRADFIRFRLEFFKPFAGTNTAEFTFRPQGNQTSVTWAMFGRSDSFICKAMSLVMNCEKMIGGQFDQGLAQLKRIAEGEAANATVRV